MFNWFDLLRTNVYLLKKSDDGDQSNDDEPKRKRRRRNSSRQDEEGDADEEPELPRTRVRSSKPAITKTDDGSVSENSTENNEVPNSDGMTDTYVSASSLKAALTASGTVCRAIDIVLSGSNVNAFACIRPPGHHCGRNGCTKGSISTGFCLLNNAAIGLTYARVAWGLKKVAIVDIDVHFGNGTAEIVRNDPNTFFASIQMIYGPKNDGNYYHVTNKNCGCGFYPPNQGVTEILDNYVSVGVYPADIFAMECNTTGKKRKSSVYLSVDSDGESQKEAKMEVEEPVQTSSSESDLQLLYGPNGYIKGIQDIIIPKLINFQPELLIISGMNYLSQTLFLYLGFFSWV